MKSYYFKPLLAILIFMITTSAHPANTNQVATYQAQQEAAYKAATATAAAKTASSRAVLSTTTKSSTTAVMSTMSKTTATPVINPNLATPKLTSSTSISQSATSTVKPSDKTLRNKHITDSSTDGGSGSQGISNVSGPSDTGSYVTTSPTAAQ